MGKYTEKKELFDNLAAEFFESKGGEVKLLGGPLADLASWHPPMPLRNTSAGQTSRSTFLGLSGIRII